MDWEKWEEWLRRIFYWYGYMTEITMIKPEGKIFLSLLLSISRSLSYHSNHCWFISLIKYSLSRLLYTKFGPFLILFDILCSPCLHIYTNISYQICVCVLHLSSWPPSVMQKLFLNMKIFIFKFQWSQHDEL